MISQNFNDNWIYYLEGSGNRQIVTLPHDAMLHTGRDPKSPGKDANGYFLGGIYHYEKKVPIPADWKEKTVSIAFGGVYRNTVVYVNGKEAGHRPYGYIPFEVCLDEFLKYGQENTIAVVADNSKLPNSRWYSGGGIYRNVKLLLADKAHIPYRGVKATTISVNPAKIQLDTKVVVPEGASYEVQIAILDGENIVACATGASVELQIPDAKLWTAECPHLYHYRATLICNGRETDTAQGDFGIRALSWSPDGFLVNGTRTLFQGACIHHDNGLLGACSFREAEERKVRILKEQGYNALRISHNPASDELLEACDRLGMYVIDESFDMWYLSKNKYDYSLDFKQWYLADTQTMVERDYNHPCVVMYSIGNELSEPAKEEGLKYAHEMVALVRNLDSTRAVTAGINLLVIMMSASGKGLFDEGGLAKNYANETPDGKKPRKKKERPSGSLMFNMMMTVMGKGLNRISNSKKADRATTPILDMLDVAGYNYASGRYRLEGKAHPDRIVVGSETYPQDIADNWEMVKKFPYLIGDFMWTGWDYLGETALGAWNYEGVSMMNVHYPWLLSGAGAVDILGRPGAAAKYAACIWGALEKPYIGVRPLNHKGVRVTKSAWRGTNAIDSWSWQNCDGNSGIAEVYSSVGDFAELRINKKSMGKKRLKKNKAMFKVTYSAGMIEAIITDRNGNEVGRSALHSAQSSRLCLIPEKDQIEKDSIAYLNIMIADEEGVWESNQDQRITIAVENGELLGFGSANPSTEDLYTGTTASTFYGHAQAIVRGNKAGVLKVTVTGQDGSIARTEITVV